jgi:hypothetical protein
MFFRGLVSFGDFSKPPKEIVISNKGIGCLTPILLPDPNEGSNLAKLGKESTEYFEFLSDSIESVKKSV